MYSLSSQKTQSWLSWFLRGILVLGFLVLFSRLIDLQLIHGSYFRNLAEENRIRRVSVQAPRGKILARGGEVLVGNKDVKKIVEFDKGEGFTKKKLSEDIVSDNQITEPVRDYKLGAMFGHTSGYVGEVNADELGKIKGECPEKGVKKIGDYIGRIGLERQYDCLLSGTNGEVLFEVDARNKTARVLGEKEAVPGEDLKTNIDYSLQRIVAEAMVDKKGAVIVSDPKGQIMAIYSSPAFDPNSFITGNPNQVASILNDKNLPLFNRTIGGTFHPGSTFKPLVGLAALEEGSIEPDFTFNDTGSIVIKNVYGTYSYKNWYFSEYGGVEGEVGLERALARSTDTFFYKVGELLGPEHISKWSKKFGLGEKTDIDIPGEVAGLIPDPDWKLDFKGERWFLGDTYNISIGQGDLALTPIGLEASIVAFANGGKLCRPSIAHVEEDLCHDLELTGTYLDEVRKGMESVCTSGGTAYPFFDFFDKAGVKVACKTGTAQNVHEDPHAWFVAYAPSKNPQIIITVLVENGGEGSAVAAPVAREIFNYYFNVPTPQPTFSN